MDAPPAGLKARMLAIDDVDDVVALANACELHDTGELMWERADLLSDASTDGFDRDGDWIGVFEGERVVGWGMIVHRRSAWIDVHPDARRRGVGTWLRRWSEDRARAKGSDRVGQTIDDALAGAQDLLRDAGYTPRHTSWILRKEHPERPPDPVAPDGVTLRAWREEDTHEALRMFEEAFSEFSDRHPSTPATWRAMTIEREGFAPEDLILAEADGAIVGGAFILDADEIWVDKLAVHRDHRHRGIGRALLHVAFTRSFDRGYDHTSLSTDSKTGALTLYERIGMHVTRSFTNLGLDL
jgi:GNAT superfamily N-acetyltransferase